MPTITTAVRALQLGDVLVDPLPTPVGGATSYVVLDLAIAEPGPVGVQLARLGPIPAHLDRVATVAWPADTVLEVVRRRQPSADVHASVARALEESRVKAWHAMVDERDRLLEERDNLAAELLELRNHGP